MDHPHSNFLIARDTDCARLCATIIEAAEAHATRLSDCNVSAEKIAAARTLLTEYQTVLPLPRVERTSGRSNTTGLEEALDELDSLLRDRLDNLAISLKEEAPEFAREYEAARFLAGSARPVEATPAPPPAPIGA